MEPRDLRRRDQRHLEDSFYQSFDRSRLEFLLRLSDQKLDREADFLGEGSHFRAWRLRSRAPGGMPLVLKRGNSKLGNTDNPMTRQWLDAVSKLRGLGGLVPPFEILKVETMIGLVMPYGDQPLAEALPHWQPMPSRLEELDQLLTQRGLILGDVPQGRCVRGVPFVYDLSDVQIV